MERFSKIFDTESTQLLVYMEYNSDVDKTFLHQIGSIDGVQIDLKVGWDGPTQVASAEEALESYHQTRAERIARAMREIVAEVTE